MRPWTTLDSLVGRSLASCQRDLLSMVAASHLEPPISTSSCRVQRTMSVPLRTRSACHLIHLHRLQSFGDWDAATLLSASLGAAKSGSLNQFEWGPTRAVLRLRGLRPVHIWHLPQSLRFRHSFRASLADSQPDAGNPPCLNMTFL